MCPKKAMRVARQDGSITEEMCSRPDAKIEEAEQPTGLSQNGYDAHA